MVDSSHIVPGAETVVVGIGISGLWTLRWLAAQGADVVVSDSEKLSRLSPETLNEIRSLGARLETGGHRTETFLRAGKIIVSPGVPLDIEPLRAASEKGIPVMGELEFASRLVDIPIIAVTGTNGKSTVTALIGEMIERAGLRVFVGGNIGLPLIAYAAGKWSADYAVVEVSSFQLDTTENFCPFISLLLNISPDHLERYADYGAYVNSKLRIFRNQGKGDYMILNDDDALLRALVPETEADVLRYGFEKRMGRHSYFEQGDVRAGVRQDGMERFTAGSFKLPGHHNRENLLAGVLAGMVIGIDKAAIQETIDDFRGLSHRLEFVGELDGVRFYDDSKATNVDAAVRALESLDTPIILIAGGRHKGADYGALVEAAGENVKRAVLMGESRDMLAESFEGVIPYEMAGDMDEAVSLAFSHAETGDSVLLAPACSSFDMYSDYGERGRFFMFAVKRLLNGRK